MSKHKITPEDVQENQNPANKEEHRKIHTEEHKEEHTDKHKEEHNIIPQTATSESNSEELHERNSEKVKQKKKFGFSKALQIAAIIVFLIFIALFLNEVWLQPHLANRANDKAKSLYQMPNPSPVISEEANNPEPTKGSTSPIDENVSTDTQLQAQPTPDPTRDYMGRLLTFRTLLETNADVKGWIKLDNLDGKNDTKIDYVVVQSSKSDPEYYLTRDWLGNKVKAGSLFLDVKSSVEENTQNLVIHGHNMTSTDDMFHYLLRYNDKKFYDSHPIIDFNTIYKTGQWKVFSVFITNGSSDKEPLFDYTISDFKDSKAFLEFVYQLRIRSIYNTDEIDINETDQILTLSTCSYEVKDYRTVIVARRVREGEDPTVNTENVLKNTQTLYPSSYYYRYGGKAPDLADTFEAALEAGEINWYSPVD